MVEPLFALVDPPSYTLTPRSSAKTPFGAEGAADGDGFDETARFDGGRDSLKRYLHPFDQAHALPAGGLHVVVYYQGAHGLADLDADRAVAGRLDRVERSSPEEAVALQARGPGPRRSISWLIHPSLHR